MGETTWTIILVVLLALAGLGWYLSYNAARLDRLHARAEGALTALDGQLVRRAESTLELANSGDLDDASALILAAAATASLASEPQYMLDDDPLDGVTMTGRDIVEDHLTAALSTALTPEVISQLRSANSDGVGEVALVRIVDSGLRVQFARQFLNNAVDDVHRVRAKPIVRTFRLAGHAKLPQRFEFDDSLPASLGGGDKVR